MAKNHWVSGEGSYDAMVTNPYAASVGGDARSSLRSWRGPATGLRMIAARGQGIRRFGEVMAYKYHQHCL